MTYDEFEESATGSAPIEGYKFIGSFKTYRYTSAATSKFIGGELYLPLAVSRSRVKAGTQEDENLSLDLEIPFDTDVVRDYAYAQTPPKLRLEVYRAQEDDDTGLAFGLFWTGIVRGFSVAGRTAKVQVPSIFSLALQGEIPNVFYQTPCNHVLYSPHCGVNRADHLFNGVVETVAGVTITLEAPPTTANDLAAGEIVNLRNGERRMILSNNGTVVSLGYPFVDLQPGDAVEMVRGCPHDLASCKAKFNNVINYGGFPYIPADNPFEGKLG
jgi:hypothetical protein